MNNAAQKELSRREYWDERYQKEAQPSGNNEDNYEWFKTFEQLRPFFAKHLPDVSKSPRILHLGCGTSTLTADLHSLGHTNQISVDFSRFAINDMKTRYRDLEVDWEVMDVRKMSLGDNSIDVAIDKGTLDAMLHGSLWDPEDDVKENVGLYVNEVTRILKPGGIWLYITYRQPHFLKPLLSRPEIWNIEVETLGGDAGAFEYFGFVISKRNA